MSVEEQIDRLIARRAAEWFEIYRTGAEDQHGAFIVWVTESPRHLKAFLAIATQYVPIRDTLRAGSFDRNALLQRVSPRSITMLQLAGKRDLAGRHKRVTRRWVVGVAGAAIAAGAAVVTLLGWTTKHHSPLHYETAIGEQRSVQFSDGSLMNLNAESEVSVEMGDSRREIRLLHGEALFKVARDPRRPFFVYTQSAVVRAVGTEFNVYARSDGTTAVAVLEGRVELDTGSSRVRSWPDALSKLAGATSSHDKTALGPGEEAHVEKNGSIARTANANIARTVAWRQRKLIFDRATLEEIAEEFNRYNPKLQFRLESVPPGTYHFTGLFDADDPRSLALLLSKEPQLVVEEHEDEILVKRK